jgi:hypothetical protein
MTRKIEIYNVDSYNTKITINKERFTLKVGIYHADIDFSEFVLFCDKNILDTPFTIRGNLQIFEFDRVNDLNNRIHRVIKSNMKSQNNKYYCVVSFDTLTKDFDIQVRIKEKKKINIGDIFISDKHGKCFVVEKKLHGGLVIVVENLNKKPVHFSKNNFIKDFNIKKDNYIWDVN